MKSTDILDALGGVDNKFKYEAREENADSVFNKEKKSGALLKAFKIALSGAAVIALVSFAVFLGVSRFKDSTTASMLEKGADIPHTFTKMEVEKTSYTENAKESGSLKVEIPVCDITPSGKNDVDTQTNDYLMFGGMCILDVEKEYDWDNGTVTKTVNGKVVFSYTPKQQTEEAYKSVQKELGDGLLLVDFKRLGNVTEQTTFSVITTMVNFDGTARWQKLRLNPVGTAPEQFLQAYIEDGKIYVVSAIIENLFIKTEDSTDEAPSFTPDELCRELVITVYDEQTGEIISRKSAKVEIGTQTFGVHCIGKTEYGFVITVLRENWYDDPYIILLGYDGNIVSVCRYGMEYEFCSAASINGAIYLSGKYMPNGKNMSPFTHSAIISYPDKILRHEFLSIKTVNDYAYKRYKDETKAVLMVCDANLTPTKAYTQSGSYGGIISTEDNSLYWDACEIVSAYGRNSKGDDNKSDYTGATLIGSASTCVINEKGALEALTGSNNKYAMVGYRMDETDK